MRRRALVLLSFCAAEVFVADRATQEAVYVLSLGVLLLGAAFSDQRLRPEAPRDLREVAPGLQ